MIDVMIKNIEYDDKIDKDGALSLGAEKIEIDSKYMVSTFMYYFAYLYRYHMTLK